MPGEADGCAVLFQYFQVFIEAAFGDAHFAGEFSGRTGSFLADQLVQAEEKVKVLLHKTDGFLPRIRSANQDGNLAIKNTGVPEYAGGEAQKRKARKC